MWLAPQCCDSLAGYLPAPLLRMSRSFLLLVDYLVFNVLETPSRYLYTDYYTPLYTPVHPETVENSRYAARLTILNIGSVT